jgi:hypothetical protein
MQRFQGEIFNTPRLCRGDFLFKMVFDKACEISFEKIILEVESNNRKAISLYQKNLFKITGVNEKRFTMIRVLSPITPL